MNSWYFWRLRMYNKEIPDAQKLAPFSEPGILFTNLSDNSP